MGRGKQYDLQKMLDLYNKGYSYQEIADEFQIESVQSVRHAIEKGLKEDIKFNQALIKLNEAETEKEKPQEEEERKKIEEKMKPVRMGIFDFQIDSLTLDALEYFLQNKYGSKVLIDKINRVISISEELDPEEMKNFLFNSGFLTLISNAKDDDMFQLNIEIFHSSPGSLISTKKRAADLFRNGSGYEEKNKVRFALTDLIKTGRIEFDGVTLNIIDQNVSLNDVRKTIKFNGYSAKIVYSPADVVGMQGRVVIHSDGSELVTIQKISPSKFESLIRDTWRKYYDNLKEWLIICGATNNTWFNLDSFYGAYYGKVIGDFLKICSTKIMKIYEPYFEKPNEQIEVDLTYNKQFKEISMSEIQIMGMSIALFLKNPENRRKEIALLKFRTNSS